MFNYGNPGGGSELSMEKCREPNYEEMFRKMKEELEVIERFRRCLKEFVNIVGYDMFTDHKNGTNVAASLLGAVEFDLIGRERRMYDIERKMTE